MTAPLAPSRSDRLLAAAPSLVAVAVCLPLLGKAFHIDDANFVSFATQVLRDPLRPFASGAVHSNPPGHQYLLALFALPAGPRELPLHLGLLPFTLLALWGCRRLAIRFGACPTWLPGLLVACSPVFLVSATSLMPDVTMLGFLLPAMALLFEDEERPSALRLGAATLLFAVGWTLRFSGLPPLVLAALFSLWRGHRRALVPLLALGAAFGFWTWLSLVQLGAPQTLSPLVVAGSAGSGGLLLLKRILSATAALVLVTALGPAVLALAPARGTRRALELAGAAAMAACTVRPDPLWVLVGLVLLVLAWVRFPVRPPAPASSAGDARRLLGLDPDVLFLVLWAAAGLAVPLLYNQSAAKYLNLPQVPLVLLLVRAAAGDAARVRAALAGAGVSLAVALALVVSDARQAAASRDLILAQVGKARAAGAPRVWIAGIPWGALRYGGLVGATYLGGTLAPGSESLRALAPGDQLLDLSWPGQLAVPAGDVALLEERALEDAFPVRLMSAGAGYWSSDWGAAPFVFSQEPFLRAWRVQVLRAAGPP